MVIKIEEEPIKINKHLGDLERHARECSEEILDDAFVLGRYLDKLTSNDLDRFYAATGRFYRECTCSTKIVKTTK